MKETQFNVGLTMSLSIFDPSFNQLMSKQMSIKTSLDNAVIPPSILLGQCSKKIIGHTVKTNYVQSRKELIDEHSYYKLICLEKHTSGNIPELVMPKIGYLEACPKGGILAMNHM